jgi:CheY-like chemotaxis protein
MSGLCEGGAPVDATTVLVVDDQALVRQALARVLTDAGYAVVAAADGLAALDALDEQPIDAVVADVSMAHLDGIGLLAALRTREPSMPVVLMTAGDQDLTGLGVPVLRKPFDVEDLLALVPRRGAVSNEDRLLFEVPS